MEVTRIDRARARVPEHPEYFDGSVRMQPLYPGRDGQESEVVAVFFEAGARTIPHTHESAQVLHVVAGRCVVVTERTRLVAAAGEVVTVPAGLWHWHGATADGPACHVSVKLPGRTDWTVPRRDWAAG